MHKINLYSDGACSGNPGPGGWGAILIFGNYQKEFSGATPDTTNNRMELSAVIEGLRKIKEPCEVTVYSDSAYVVNAFTQGWLQNWQKNGWRTGGKKAVQNTDLWRELAELVKQHRVSFVKVKGHSDNKFNNRCDELARIAIQEKKYA
ncbi:MAG: ribonuclease HI [Firmicutes bacterium]|nr:ribonuclease HI [Bacillota bacterium]